VLTSNVFGVLKNVDNYFLRNVIKEITGIAIPMEQEIIVNFWPTEYKFHADKNLAAEPDCVIETGKYIILVEAKYYSDFGGDIFATGANQLKREFALLNHLVDERKNDTSTSQGYLLIITNDHLEPTERIKKQFGLSKKPRNVRWVNWQTINFILKNCIRDYDYNCKSSSVWVKELIELLDHKGLRSFRGFRDLFSSNERSPSFEAPRKRSFLFFDTWSCSRSATFRGYQNIGRGLFTRHKRLQIVERVFFNK